MGVNRKWAEQIRLDWKKTATDQPLEIPLVVAGEEIFNAREVNQSVDPSQINDGVVISPWNFPIAIPCGGIVAALAAGNTVIFKPSSEAVPVAWLLCQCFWRAGVSTSTLQFLPCSGATTAARLTDHPDVAFIILTGGTDTGLNILKQRPDVLLAAETGGKNATIVTSMADRDQAIGNVIYSAFGNSGQKCSATSLLICEDEIYDDPGFKRQLIDAAKSFSTGSVLTNKITQFLEGKEGQRLIGNARLVRESDDDLITRIPKIDRIRYATPTRVPHKVIEAAARTGFYIARSPVMMDGSIELLQYYRQQSICHNYHRYGNLEERASEFDLA